MILHISGDISRYYVETLCLIFFPGSTFGEDESVREGIPEVTVTVCSDDEEVTAYTAIKLNDKISESTASVSFSEPVAVATHAAVAVGRAMFAAGKELIGHTPPWGILTGIRPAKVACGLLRSGRGILKTKKILRDEYFLNPQKAALATAVATAELRHIKKMKDNTCSIYISIPFCPSRCAYCSFVSYTTARLLSMIDEYLVALTKELDEIFDTASELGLVVNTIYIGGGTPTTLNEEQLSFLLKKIKSRIDTDKLAEFTLEAGRPDTITQKKLSIAKKYGVTRISVNPQTLNDDVLREIGRRHTVEDFYKAYKMAKRSGIKDINVDLIAGLPGDDFKNFSETVDKIIDLEPSNITVHTFSVKKASDALKKNSNVYSLSGNDAGKSVSYSQLKTKFSGYKPYYMYRQKNTVGNLENVGFSREGRESIYNINMMEELETIFGAGAGAVTKLVDTSGDSVRIERIFNQKYPYEYLRGRNSIEVDDTKITKKEKIIRFFKDFKG